SAPGPGPRRGPPRGVPGGGVSTVDLAGISPTRQSRQAAVNFLAGRVGERYGKRYSNHLLEIPPEGRRPRNPRLGRHVTQYAL
ncbi:hypothetical protein THAOC_06685, partial [Thalassiosira oceanica]